MVIKWLKTRAVSNLRQPLGLCNVRPCIRQHVCRHAVTAIGYVMDTVTVSVWMSILELDTSMCFCWNAQKCAQSPGKKPRNVSVGKQCDIAWLGGGPELGLLSSNWRRHNDSFGKSPSISVLRKTLLLLLCYTYRYIHASAPLRGVRRSLHLAEDFAVVKARPVKIDYYISL